MAFLWKSLVSQAFLKMKKFLAFFDFFLCSNVNLTHIRSQFEDEPRQRTACEFHKHTDVNAFDELWRLKPSARDEFLEVESLKF